MSTPSITVAVPLLALLAAATVTDLVSRRIPNGISLGGAVVGLLVQTSLFGPAGAAACVAGWLFGLVLFLPLYALDGTAAGDVKLAAMVGAFLGPVNGLLAGLLGLMAGAVVAGTALTTNVLLQRVDDSRLPRAVGSVVFAAPSACLQKIPYAAAIALGAAAIVFQPAWLMDLLSIRGLS
jgi:prepilin peptidase CpaA